MPLLSRYHSGSYSDEQYNLEKRIVRHSLFVSIALIVVLWLVKLFEFEFDLDFSTWGVLPHDVSGLRGIIFSPLIHANFNHLIANTIPLFILTFSLFFFYRRSSYLIFVLLYLFSGIFVWLGGREALHIGASGLIYGLAAFLFTSGVIGFNIRLLTISMIVSLVYGGMFWGIFPLKPEISWESHLWGGISGFGLAFFYRKPVPAEPLEEEVEDYEEFEDNLPQSVFESEEDSTR
ncbi:MAG TPA: rhomboid family intramembrane serine protease [Prolixibacteraceae bacterium]|nr:rhomboid family intramembrane serine protease [Prolixibacteraceae bacterium]